jgi:hypothetical protein
MSDTQRIDDIINGYIPPQQEIEKVEAEPAEAEELSSSEDKSDPVSPKEEAAEKPEKEAKDIGEKPDTVKPEAKEAAETDEYGIEVPKARTYSEDEVQRMIKDRLSRGQHAQPQQQQPQQQQGADFQLDPNSDQPWEVQLESFVKGTIDKVNRETQTKQWQAQEQERQTNFEVKFSTGMEKFTDFRDVVGQFPITDSMMMAIRDMDNPATFLYAAAKLRPDEVKRIASLSDPFQQAKEIGRLDEQMRKAKNISKTAAPLKTITSDVSTSRPTTKKSIDSLIQNHAKSKLRPTK